MRSVSFILILSVLFLGGTSASQVDSLLNVLDVAQHSNDLSHLYDLHYNLGSAFGDSEYEAYEKAVHHYILAYEIAQKLDENEKLSNSLYGIANSHQRLNNYQKALEFYDKIAELEIGEESESEANPKKGHAFTQMSAIYQALGDYEKAYEYQMQALPTYDQVNDSLGMANAQYNLGSIFFYQNQFEQSLEHYQKAKVICDAINNDRFIYSCLAALGSVNEKLGNSEKSLQYNQHSLKLAEKLNYKTGIAYAKGNIAANYRGQGNFKIAEAYLKESISIKMELGDTWGAIGSEIDIARLYQMWGKPKLTITILKGTLSLAQQVDSKTRKPEIYQLMATAYNDLNNIEQAYYYTLEYISLKDSLISEKTLEEMGQSKRRYEVQKNEYQINMLKKENELLGKDKELQKLQIYIFAITVIAFIMFLWWYKSKLKYQNSVNKLLEEKNDLLNDKNDEIEVKNKQLENSNEDLQQFAYVASHDLKEPLRMINSYTTLLNKRYNEMYDDSGKEFMHYIIDAVKRMETLLDDLLDFSRVGKQAPPDNYISVEDIMVYVEANLRHRLQTLNATLVVKNENLPSVKAHRTQLMQLLQNLVSNGVKFKGEKDPVVTVDCHKKDNQYIISVKDNGIGISKENLEKVFEMFRRLHSRSEYEGTGIGLATCKRIVSTWGGDIWVESTEGEGSTFFFSIPESSSKPPVVTSDKAAVA